MNQTNIPEVSTEQFSLAYLVEVQKALEYKYDNRHARKLLREWCKEDLQDMNQELPKEIRNAMLDILCALVVRGKRVSLSALIEMLADRDKDLAMQADYILQASVELCELDLAGLEWDNKQRMYLTPKTELTEDQLSILDELQYKIPMIVPPLKTNLHGDNRGAGYYTKGSDSLILNNYHDYDIDSTVLDRFNSIPYTLNTHLMVNIRNMWKCMETSNNPDARVHHDTIVNFERFNKGVAKTSAILINHGNKFYFTHKYDKRGRVYCGGYHLNTQGNSYAKAQLEFANKQAVSDEINFF